MATIDDNLGGLRNRARRHLHEVAPDNSFFSDTFMDQQINVSYRRRSAQLVMAHEGFFTNVATRDITADTSRYAWPPGFERLLKMEIVRTDGTTVPLERNERHYAVNLANTGGDSQDSYAPQYRPISGGFTMEPTPKTTVANGLRIEYYGLPTQMQNDGDSLHSDFPRSFDELIVLDCVIACMDSENMMESGAMRTSIRNRAEWEHDWSRYIDNRVISTNKIMPFAPHYADA
jgi:hypothetical protein